MSMETGMSTGVKNSQKTGSLWYSQTSQADSSSGRSSRTGTGGFMDTFDRALKESRKNADQAKPSNANQSPGQKTTDQTGRTDKNDRNQEEGTIKKSPSKPREAAGDRDNASQKITDEAAAAAAETMETPETRAAETDGETAETTTGRDSRDLGLEAPEYAKPEALFQGNDPMTAMMALTGNALGSGNTADAGSLSPKTAGTGAAALDTKAIAGVPGQPEQADIRAELSGFESGAALGSRESAQNQTADRTEYTGLKEGLENAEILKNQNAEGQSEQSGGQMTGDSQENRNFSDMLKSRLESRGNTGALKNGAAEKEQEAGAASDNQLLEELKRSADGRTGGFMDRLAEAGMNRGVMTAQTAAADTAGRLETPVAEQLKAGLEQGMKRELQEFTIKLKPEGLGDIIVHMATVGGKTAVRIGASNQETEKLISSQMVSLKEMLEPLHAEVEEVYRNSQNAMEFAQSGQEMYQQQSRFGAARSRHFSDNDLPDEQEDYLPEAERMAAESQAGRLYAYV